FYPDQNTKYEDVRPANNKMEARLCGIDLLLDELLEDSMPLEKLAG
ncbi:12592_t:CDS:1, partial [Rhizophagus irregularis]